MLILMGAISSVGLVIILALSFLIKLLAIFLVVKETRYTSFLRIFLSLVFLCVPFSGIIYLILNYKKIPNITN